MYPTFTNNLENLKVGDLIQLRKCLTDLFGVVPDTDWEMLTNELEYLHVLKYTNLKSIGQNDRYIWFVASGAVRIYEIQKNAECTLHFYVENALFMDFHSSLFNNTAEYGIKTEEQCRLFRIHYNKILELYSNSVCLERIGRMLAEHQALVEYELRRFLLHMDASEKYAHLVQSYPYIFKRFAQKDIASFIGITPTSLSRLRKNRSLTAS